MALIANALLMLALPVAYALAACRGDGVRWTWLGVGAAAFVGSQIVHLPILWGWEALTRAGLLPGFGPVADALVLGVLAALCEEPARALAFRFGLARERGTRAARIVGAGHGGIEALVFGLLALLGAVNVLAMRGMSAADLEAAGAAPEAAAAAVAQVAQALAMPWYEVLGGAFERAITIPFHIACSVLVMASLRRRSAWPFVVAVLAHATVDSAIGLLGHVGQSGWALELELAALAVPFAIGVIAWSRRAEPAEADVSA